MGSSARQHPDMRCGYRGKTSALPRRKISRRPVDQTSACTHPERRHKVESSAQQHPGVRWGLVAETAGEENRDASASGIASPVTSRVGHTGTCELIALRGNSWLDTFFPLLPFSLLLCGVFCALLCVVCVVCVVCGCVRGRGRGVCGVTVCTSNTRTC